MANYGWDVVLSRSAMPVTGGTVNGGAFSVPKNAVAMTLFVPSLASSATVKLQSLTPQPDDQVTDAWLDCSTFDLAGGGTPIALSAIPGNAATTVPITACGGGVLRPVASATQVSAPVTIVVAFLCRS